MNLKSVAYIALSLCLFVACAGEQGPLGKSPEEVSRMWIDLYNKDSFDSLKVISTGQALEVVLSSLEPDESLEGFGMYDDDEEPLPPVLVATMNCTEDGADKATCVYCCNEGAEETFHLVKEGEQWKVKEIISDLEDFDGDFEDSGLLDSMLNKMDTTNIE